MFDDSKIDKLIDTRIKTNSKKWSRYNNETIPFWIADMDFKSPEFLVADIINRAKENYFGYTDPPKDLRENIVNWYKNFKKSIINGENIVFSTSVLNSYETILDSYLDKNDEILFFTPIYAQLMKIAGRNYNVIQFDLEEFTNEVNFKKLYNQIDSLKSLKAIVLCNPQNPIGKIWKAWELEKIVSLCREKNILLISDEIHSDIIYNGYEYKTLFNFVKKDDKKMFVLNSPGKSFNVSGLKASYIISCQNDVDFITSKIKERRYNEIDIFSLVAMNSLYKNIEKSISWLQKTNYMIETNYNLLKKYLNKNKRVEISKAESTYLIWIKINESYCKDSNEIREKLIKLYKIDLHEGTIFGNVGKYYLRMNIACPEKILVTGLERLLCALNNKDI